MNQTTSHTTTKRGPRKHVDCYTITSVYDQSTDFIKGLCDKETFKNLCKEYNRMIVSLLIFKRKELKLPFAFGKIFIDKNKNTYNDNKLRIDYVETKKIGQTVYYLNQHTRGFYYKFKWTKMPRKNILRYRFIPSRVVRQSLYAAIINNKLGY